MITPEYLAWIINQSSVQNIIASISKGSGMPFIARDDFADVRIDIPDLETQHRIVELDKLSQQEQLLLGKIQQKRKELVEAVMLNKIKKQ